MIECTKHEGCGMNKVFLIKCLQCGEEATIPLLGRWICPSGNEKHEPIKVEGPFEK